MAQDPRPVETVNCIFCGAQPAQPCVVNGTKQPALSTHSMRYRKWKNVVTKARMPSMLTYDFPLRTDMIVRLTLPFPLSLEDAERINNFVAAAAFKAA